MLCEIYQLYEEHDNKIMLDECHTKYDERRYKKTVKILQKRHF